MKDFMGLMDRNLKTVVIAINGYICLSGVLFLEDLKKVVTVAIPLALADILCFKVEHDRGKEKQKKEEDKKKY